MFVERVYEVKVTFVIGLGFDSDSPDLAEGPKSAKLKSWLAENIQDNVEKLDPGYVADGITSVKLIAETED